MYIIWGTHNWSILTSKTWLLMLTCIRQLPFSIDCPMGWNRSIAWSASITFVWSTSTIRNAVMLTELYLKSSRSNVSISWNRFLKIDFEGDGMTTKINSKLNLNCPIIWSEFITFDFYKNFSFFVKIVGLHFFRKFRKYFYYFTGFIFILLVCEWSKKNNNYFTNIARQ